MPGMYIMASLRDEHGAVRDRQDMGIADPNRQLDFENREPYWTIIFVTLLTIIKLFPVHTGRVRTRTRTYTNPNGTEANASGRSSRACVGRE
jgi:hypothetical protein